MSAIEAKLLETSKFKKKKGEDRQAYLKRLVESVQKKSDDPDSGDAFWDSLMDNELGETAQNWVNAGIKAINAAREAGTEDEVEIEDFPDVEDTDADADDGAGDDDKKEDTVLEASEDKDTPKTKKSKKAKVAAKSDKKPEKKVAAKEKEKPAKKAVAKSNGAGRRGTGVSQYSVIRDMIYGNTEIKTDELMERLIKKGHKPSKYAVTTIKSICVQTLKELKARGNLKGIDI